MGQIADNQRAAVCCAICSIFAMEEHAVAFNSGGDTFENRLAASEADGDSDVRKLLASISGMRTSLSIANGSMYCAGIDGKLNTHVELMERTAAAKMDFQCAGLREHVVLLQFMAGGGSDGKTWCSDFPEKGTFAELLALFRETLQKFNIKALIQARNDCFAGKAQLMELLRLYETLPNEADQKLLTDLDNAVVKSVITEQEGIAMHTFMKGVDKVKVRSAVLAIRSALKAHKVEMPSLTPVLNDRCQAALSFK